MIRCYCEACEEECTPRLRDEGIGFYDYGSERRLHRDMTVVSDCCGEPCMKLGTTERLTPADAER